MACVRVDTKKNAKDIASPIYPLKSIHATAESLVAKTSVVSLKSSAIVLLDGCEEDRLEA